WVQCDTCKKWRRLPDFVDPDQLPLKWHCEMNIYDAARANCRYLRVYMLLVMTG
ncbi:unnamed protein product, partial [Ectocarpus sp. 12 AP-2014]